jgi:hypothetical protein
VSRGGEGQGPGSMAHDPEATVHAPELPPLWLRKGRVQVTLRVPERAEERVTVHVPEAIQPEGRRGLVHALIWVH